ncbi:hypothetical protein Pcinc_026696 [Petrolisthes cinctipes]|uniref:Uncharacterized protein n=1 Tax=Petrolisthes cinctipes TaxID=88211 RepID=A0AAE1F5Z5_PETCI|nr:hypothetical protein Pcinc_026696 [Petrolisthes cinctipes]
MQLKEEIQHPKEEYYFGLENGTCTELAHLICPFQSLPVATCHPHHPSKVQNVGMDRRQAATHPCSMHCLPVFRQTDNLPLLQGMNRFTTIAYKNQASNHLFL